MNTSFRNSRESKVLFLVSITIAIFRLLGSVLNVYYFAFTGAVFELLNLPSLALLFCLPLYSLYVFWKERFNPRSLALYSALVSMATIVLLIALG